MSSLPAAVQFFRSKDRRLYSPAFGKGTSEDLVLGCISVRLSVGGVSLLLEEVRRAPRFLWEKSYTFALRGYSRLIQLG